MNFILNNNESIADIDVYKEDGSPLDLETIKLGDKLIINVTLKSEDYYIAYWKLNSEVIDTLSEQMELTLVNANINITPVYRKKSNKDSKELITSFFNFDLEHPVQMEVEKSYDGSVNIILTDNYNEPKLINSGFSVREDNSYMLIDRFGLNNTNRYSLSDKTNFDLLTSLYRNSSKLSYIEYLGIEEGGNLPIGSYNFYIVSCDKDGNETDFIAESGVINVAKGVDGDPFSVDGGIENENSGKIIKLKIHNIDRAYHYIKIYFTRETGGYHTSSNTYAYKIDLLYTIDKNSNTCLIMLSGYESKLEISVNDLNIGYFNSDLVKTFAINLNILFLANLTELNQDEDEDRFLTELSYKIIPIIDTSKLINMDSSYKYIINDD